ncbi:hypothetical protein F4824DRAFT_489379 [Ustulina deusta]|nr:hypothetical protein F4824DRAFT_489379 [Ustulina deusta]
MDQYEFNQFTNEYLPFLDPNYGNNYLATIDPVLLPFGSGSDFPFEQQEQLGWEGQSWLALPSPHVGQHFVISQSPFKCHCGKEFARLYTLERHIQSARKHVVPEHPCHECTAYQGKNGFRRKDHLVQHLRVFHKYDHDQLAALFRPRRTRMLHIPVCHFESCEYYRGPEFKDLDIGQQEKNRPFDKQSDYTAHMKEEHDWSPYPCKVPGCTKLDGKGFFSTTALEKHCKEKHPGSTIPVHTPQNDVAETVRCDYCQKNIKSSYLTTHQSSYCKGEHCHELVLYREQDSHEWRDCKGKVKCEHCHKLVEKQQLPQHRRESCAGKRKCKRCSKMVESRLLRWGRCTDCCN